MSQDKETIKKKKAEWYLKNKARIRAEAKEKYEENKEKILEKQRLYRLQNPESYKKTYLGYQRRNKEVIAKKCKRYYLKNKEKVDRVSAEWRNKNRQKVRLYGHNRRVRESNGRLSKDIEQKLFILQKGKCACCRVDLAKVVVHLDHIYPLINGGQNIDSNVQLLCQPCNQNKYTKHPIDFMQERGFLL